MRPRRSPVLTARSGDKRNSRRPEANPGETDSDAVPGRFKLPPPSEPMAVARRALAAEFMDRDGHLLLRHWHGEFWEWRTTHWAEMSDAGLRSRIYRWLEDAVYVKPTTGDLAPWAPNRRKISDVLDALRATTYTAEWTRMPAWLERKGETPAPDCVVSCANGLLDVPTGTLLDHDPNFFNGVAVPFAFDRDAPTPKRWLRFLRELWPSDDAAKAALAEYMGYVIGGRRDLQKILLLVGPTRSGKGVIARVLQALVGAGNHVGPTLASLGTNFGLSPLIGKPLAIVSDARLGHSGNVQQIVERLLSISGEDALTIDRKYRVPWTGTLPTRFVVISNELPRLVDASGAIANRFLILTLNQSWLGREDPSLTDQLLEELPGILGWVLEGLERLKTQGRFTQPTSSADAIAALADLTSPTSAFVRERCVVGPGKAVAVERLYSEWKLWAEDNGHRPVSIQTFGRDMRAAVPGVTVTRPRDGDARTRWFAGVGLLARTQSEERGPSRTDDLSHLGHVTADVLVRDGPRLSPMQPEHDDRVEAPTWNRASGLGWRQRSAGLSTVACGDYKGHQTHHRRVRDAWVCDLCSLPPSRSSAPS